MPTKHQLGHLLRDLRLRRGLSLKHLCDRAQLSRRTIEYWEAGERSPRVPELEAVLNALEVVGSERVQMLALLTTPRGIYLAHRTMQSDTEVSADPVPDLGDLLRAMRLRRGWPVARLAEAMSITRQTVHRWETTRSFPTEENVVRAGRLLDAHPEEMAALGARCLRPSLWPSSFTLDDCRRQFEQLQGLTRYGCHPLLDLSILALKRQLRLLIAATPEALGLLVQLDVAYATWLFYQARFTEAQAALNSARNFDAANRPPYRLAAELLNLQAALRGNGPGGTRAALTTLQNGWEGIPAENHGTVYCDLALYAATLQQFDPVDDWLGLAGQVFERAYDEKAEENAYYRLTYGRVCVAMGKPAEAMEWLPELPSGPDDISIVAALRFWSQALVAVGEPDAAQSFLLRQGALLDTHSIPLLRRSWEADMAKLA